MDMHQQILGVPAWSVYLTSGGLLFAVIGYFLAGTRGNGCWGCFLGFLLGPLGLLIAMLIPERRA
jgi:hypothetical protein